MTSRMIRATLIIACAMGLFAVQQPAWAQIDFTPAGVEIDAQGVLRTKVFQ